MAEYVIAGLILGGTALSAISQKKQGEETRKLYQQRAAIAEEEAKAVTKVTDYQARERGKEGRRDVARALVLFAKSGVKPKLGTAGLVGKEIEEEYRKDMAFIMEGGETEASRLRSEAAIERRIGKGAERAGRWGAASTVMTGLGTAGMFAYGQGMFSRTKTSTTYGRSGTAIKRRSQWLGPSRRPYRR